MCEYRNIRRIMYDDACFVPVCPKCKRTVKADESVTIYEYPPIIRESNATCPKCGRVEMIFEGFFEA